MSNPPLLQAAIAAHRFGLGEPTLEPLAADPQGWLLAQIGPAEPARGSGLLSTRDGLRLVAAEREKRQAAQNPPPGMTAEQLLAGHYRDANVADARSHLASAAFGSRPFMERLQLFWANHFTVSLAKGSARGLVGAFERDAIRPNLNGSFETLLHAATTHPAMLRYLDNSQSAGPRSVFVARARRRAERIGEAARVTGLNENLSREVLELHTLGATSGRAAADGAVYTQADVTAFAAVLTGWRVGQDAADATSPFDRHGTARTESCSASATRKGRRARAVPTTRAIGDGPLRRTKLARHFVATNRRQRGRADDGFVQSSGDLPTLYRALSQPEAWDRRSAS